MTIKADLRTRIIDVQPKGDKESDMPIFNMNTWAYEQELGAWDSTSTRCVLETSSRSLRMLTESGDGIRYVSLQSAGLGAFILVDGGGCGPVFLCRGFWDLGFDKAAMSLGQLPSAMSYGVGMSGWTVRYSSAKSHNSGMAIV